MGNPSIGFDLSAVPEAKQDVAVDLPILRDGSTAVGVNFTTMGIYHSVCMTPGEARRLADLLREFAVRADRGLRTNDPL